MWEVPNIWKGEQCFIIGGGASIPRQFGVPEEVINSVYKGGLGPDAYSPYMSELHDKHIIAVNMSYKLGNWVDILFFGDTGFYDKKTNEIEAFPGLTASCALELPEGHGVHHIRRSKSQLGIDFAADRICFNNNSGGAAINLAVHLGVERIVLLGFDMKLDEQKNQHWHKYYNGNPKTVIHTFKTQTRSFANIAKALKDRVEVFNASPDSRIEDFPKVEVKYLL